MKRLLLPMLALAVLTGCVQTATGPVPFTHADGYAAVDQAFARFGPSVVACAHGVASRESNHWPYAGLPPGTVNTTHHGVFQLHDGFKGSINAGAATLGRVPSFFDPYVNAFAAAIGFQAAGGSFRRNWAGTTPGGCP